MACKQTGLGEIQEKMYRVKTLRAGNHMVDRLRDVSNFGDGDSAILERAKYTRERDISRRRDIAFSRKAIFSRAHACISPGLPKLETTRSLHACPR